MSAANFDARIGAILPLVVQPRNERYHPALIAIPIILTTGTILANLGGAGATIMSCPKIVADSTDYAHLGAYTILIGGMPISLLAYASDLFLLFKSSRSLNEVNCTLVMNVAAQLFFGLMSGVLSTSWETCGMTNEQAKYAGWIIGLQCVCFAPLMLNSSIINPHFLMRNAR